MTGMPEPNDEPDARPKLTELSEDTVRLADLPRFPGMTGWFKPSLLAKLLLRVVISDLFGQYADRRLIVAALDPVDKLKHLERAKRFEREPDDNGPVWIDYVADLGDGFDPTYAVAHLLAQPSLQIGAHNLPRGRLLIMGGDQVYPTATRDDYKIRMRLPYSFALPGADGADPAPILLIPGNHDWYDGLVNFLAIFCREKPAALGRWRSGQRRSYFAVKLTEKWWIWGIDISLVRDMDQPQAEYFVAIAECMPDGANIILCSAEPGWYKAETQDDAYRTLSYAAGIADDADKDLRIPLILSGDSHHYAHYEGGGRHYITSGGGGAFLHGTLELKDRIKGEWLKEPPVELLLKGCYPTKQDSKRLLAGNLQFARLNQGFSFLFAWFYLGFVILLTSAPLVYDSAAFAWIMLFGGLFSYSAYQEKSRYWRVALLTGLHASCHFNVVAAAALLAVWLNNAFFPGQEWHWFVWFLVLAIPVLSLGTFIAGSIFGLFLLVGSRWFDLGHADAFSSMRLQSHRHFLRIRIDGDNATVFPIRLDAVPQRREWRDNPGRTADPHGSPSLFIAEPELRPGLVGEKPIIVEARRAPSTDDVKQPEELPTAE